MGLLLAGTAGAMPVYEFAFDRPSYTVDPSGTVDVAVYKATIVLRSRWAAGGSVAWGGPSRSEGRPGSRRGPGGPARHAPRGFHAASSPLLVAVAPGAGLSPPGLGRPAARDDHEGRRG